MVIPAEYDIKRLFKIFQNGQSVLSRIQFNNKGIVYHELLHTYSYISKSSKLLKFFLLIFFSKIG